VYIKKADGRPTPLGVAALEDKLGHNRAVPPSSTRYTEEDFSASRMASARGAASIDALDALSYALTKKKG